MFSSCFIRFFVFSLPIRAAIKPHFEHKRLKIKREKDRIRRWDNSRKKRLNAPWMERQYNIDLCFMRMRAAIILHWKENGKSQEAGQQIELNHLRVRSFNKEWCRIQTEYQLMAWLFIIYHFSSLNNSVRHQICPLFAIHYNCKINAVSTSLFAPSRHTYIKEKKTLYNSLVCILIAPRVSFIYFFNI